MTLDEYCALHGTLEELASLIHSHFPELPIELLTKLLPHVSLAGRPNTFDMALVGHKGQVWVVREFPGHQNSFGHNPLEDLAGEDRYLRFDTNKLTQLPNWLPEEFWQLSSSHEDIDGLPMSGLIYWPAPNTDDVMDEE